MAKKLFLIIGIICFTNILFASTPPQIFNFRIESSEPNRIYFDSDKVISGSNINGFTVSNKSISSISINEGAMSNHYITVSNKFTYWDNNTIRYEGGGDIKDTNNNPLIDFTLSYIKNKIPEPNTSKNRYVTTSANGGGDGTSEASAWTLKQAFSKANSGMTVWIKAGNYGNQNLAIYNDGTASSPIKFIGYKNSTGDITSNYFDYGKSWSTSEMPTLTGASASDGHAIQLMGTNYVVFRNLQITNYYHGIRANNTRNSNLVFDRINGKLFGGNSTKGADVNGSFMNFQTFVSAGSGSYRPFTSNDHIKLLDCRSVNANMHGIALFGSGNNLIDGWKSYNDRTGMNERQDYHISINGHNNIIRNCYAENFNTTSTNAATHGIGIRGSSNLDNDYNLIELSKGVNLNESFYIRNYGCDYNVIKDCYAGNNANAYNHKMKEHSGAVYLWGGVSNNIIERVVSNEVSIAIGFIDNNEEGNTNDKSIGYNNIIRNCVFNGHRFGIYVNGYSGSALHNNKIINTTFNDGTFLFRDVSPNADIKNLEIINSNFSNFSQKANYFPLTGLNFSNSNFYNFKTSWKPSGSNNISVDPKFVSVSARDFSLQADSKLRDAGYRDNENKYDIIKNYRFNDSSPDIGAYEYTDNTMGYINANAGLDVEICKGSETTLNATGGSEFLWSTGETTASITVNPEETTTYTVTVSDGDNSESDEVLVTVKDAPSVTLGDAIDSCIGSEVILTAEGNGEFLWSTGDTGSSIKVNPLETTTYVVTSSIECGSENLSVSDSIVVNINSDLVVTAGLDVTSCLGADVVLTAEGTGDFLWNTGETTSSITVNPTETTTFTVTSSNGECTVSDDVIITIIEQPEVSLGNDITICNASEVTLIANGTGNFLWSTGETTASIDVNPLETTEYIVTANVNCGTEVLSVSDTIVVNVTPELTLNVSDDVAFCSSQEVTLTADSNGDVLWSTGETTKDIVINPTETTTYTVTSNLGDCTLTDEVTITISEQPTVDLGPDLTLCSGNEITLTAAGNGAFLWSTGSTKKNVKVSPTETTEYIVTASINCGTEILSVTDTLVVTVIPGVTLSVSDDVATCLGTEVTLTAEGNANFLWSTGETTASVIVTPMETTTYSVTSGSGDCAVTEEVIVTVQEAPEVTLGNDKTICFGEEVTLIADGVGVFLWSTGETTKSITVNPNETKTYSVIATTNCGGNEVKVSDEITVNVSEDATLSVSDDVTICTGSEVTLTAEGNGDFLWNNGQTTASIIVSPSETTAYSVTSGSGNCSKSAEVLVTVDQFPIVNLGEDINICYGDEVFITAEGNGDFLWSNGTFGPSIKVNPLVTTTYSVVASSECGSTATDEITVNVGSQILLDAGEDKSICTGEFVTLTAQGNGNFLWNTGETTASITVSPDSPTTYLVSSTIGECSVFDEVLVLVENSPTVNLGEDENICNGESITLIAEGIGNYLWNTGEVTSSITVSPTKTTTYSIIASSNCSSDATDEITVFVNERVNANAGSDVTIEQGENINLTATGGNSYLWSTGETSQSINVEPDITTTYTVEVDNGTNCTGTDNVKVEVVDNISLIINDGKDITICKGDELILKARGSANYLWNVGKMESTITVNPQNTTTYTVSAQKNGILESVDVIVTVEDCSSNRTIDYNVYPNPSEGIVNINIPSEKTGVKVIVSALNGKVILQREIKGDKNGVFTQINLSHVANGIYIIKMYNDNFNATQKVIVI